MAISADERPNDRLADGEEVTHADELADEQQWADADRRLDVEPLRGQLYFSARRRWNSDPEGSLFFDGGYHLLPQRRFYGWNWADMRWEHAFNKDLVRWHELGARVWPDEFGAGFSGSVVVDHENTSGFGRGGRPPIVVIYTAAGNPTTQCLAYWNGEGRGEFSFKKYDRNPVVPEIAPGNRDPKVLWHAPTKQWVMLLLVEFKTRPTIHVLVSADLKDWKTVDVIHIGSSDYTFHSPVFNDGENHVAADSATSRGTALPRGTGRQLVMLGSYSRFVGQFDGATFIPSGFRHETRRVYGSVPDSPFYSGFQPDFLTVANAPNTSAMKGVSNYPMWPPTASRQLLKGDVRSLSKAKDIPDIRKIMPPRRMPRLPKFPIP